MLQVQTRIDGLEKIEVTLEAIKWRIRRKVNRKAITAGLRLLTAAGKANAPNATGTTKKSLGHVIRKYRQGLTYLGIFGARRGQAREVVRTFSKRGKQKIKLHKTDRKNVGGFREVRDAYRTIHLTESGRKGFSAKKPLALRLPGGQVAFRRRVGPAAGTDFLARTSSTTMPSAIAATLAEMKAGTDRALREAAVGGTP